MKSTYKSPTIEVVKVESYAILQAVSGPGLSDGGQGSGSDIPQ